MSRKLSQRQIERIAQVAHETNRAYCASLGDFSQIPWDDAPDWQRASAIAGVEGIANGEINGPGDSHRSWLKQKEADGWTFGEVKDPVAKTHPCMVSFEELPAEQQSKDFIFFGVVDTMIRVTLLP